MRFKFLQLNKAREFALQNKDYSQEYSGRRKFIKAMGIGALAWNPMVSSIKGLNTEKIIVEAKTNHLKVLKGDKLAWEISDKYFESGLFIQMEETDVNYLIRANNLIFKSTNLKFSLNTTINKITGDCSFEMPEFAFVWHGNFNDFIEGTEPIKGKAQVNDTICLLSKSELLKANGSFNLELTPNWRFGLTSSKNIQLQKNDKLYTTGNVIIEPSYSSEKDVFRRNFNLFTCITLPEFQDWKYFVNDIDLCEGKLKSDDEITAEICIGLSHASSKEKIIWINPNASEVVFQPEQISNSEIKFEQFFYYAEYLNGEKTQNYISASLPEKGFWISNSIGSFKIERDLELPDFEAFGVNDVFGEVIIEPRLHAFKPIIENAVTLSSVYQDPPKVRILQPQKKVPVQKTTLKSKTKTIEKEEQKQPVVTNPLLIVSPPKKSQQKPQKPVRKIEKAQPKLEVEFDKVKFKPKKALPIRVLRPEDMVMLEFVFHNFNFTNKGQSPYLELDNSKNAGIVEIYFQSQHTLEEAYYESTPVPDTDPLNPTDNGVKLPAKHLRACKSRLVYELAPNHEGFPLIMEELLDWDKFKLRVHPRAWIKLPDLTKVRKPSHIELDKNVKALPNENLKYLNASTTEYGLQLAQNNKFKASNLEVYKENEIQKVLAPQAGNTVKLAFNPKVIKKISWKVEPIPKLSTSIEAPTLMYISPNQTNDFYHKKSLNFRSVQDQKFTEFVQPQVSIRARTLEPLSNTKGEITELWHTRLGVKLKNGKTSVRSLPHLKTIRALWADEAVADYTVAKPRNAPFMASLDANNRQKLVHTTSNYTSGFDPFPVPVNDLMLTTLGAYLDWHAFFDVPTPQDNALNIIEWEHIATLGRDHFVKIVEEGYLFPFGHRAAVVKITERKFDPATKAAANRQRMFIVVLEKEVVYSKYDPEGSFIEFPFQAIRIDTNKTPNIDNPEKSTLINVPSGKSFKVVGRSKVKSGGGNTSYNFYIKVAQKDFLFDIVATDKEGQEHALRMPLAFMENNIARNKSLIDDVIEVYRGNSGNGFNKQYNEIDFYGQELAYAEALIKGDTAFETEMVKFDAQVYPASKKGDLKFHPKVKESKVFVSQINELTGIREAITIGMEDDDNEGNVFARVTSDSTVDFSGSSDKSGGFLLPNMGVTGLSKLQGPISGNLDDMKEFRFLSEEFFASFDNLLDAKIFGVIDIVSLLLGDSANPLKLAGSFDGLINTAKKVRKDIDTAKNEILYLENLKKETNETVEEEIQQLKATIRAKTDELKTALNDSVPRIPNLKSYLTEDGIYVEYKWQPELWGTEMNIIPGLLSVNVNDPKTALSVIHEVEKPFDIDKPATFGALARFENFEVDIEPLLAVKFNYLEFKSSSTQKTDVKVDIDKKDPIKFKGALNFVNSLQSIIPPDGFSEDGPYVKIAPSGVTTGFDISIPKVEVGVCMISNVSLGAKVTLPFTGAPLTIGFNFCKRENPFMLTISCFGGGGYFMMVTTLQGIQSIEAAFEFGAAMSLNVGVASGGVSAMGGFYFKMEIVDDVEQITLSGYLRLNGHLSVLGLISVSLEFYLALVAVIYQGKVQKMEGVASLKVKVEVLFFSKTVSVTVRRELKGADADPKFIEMIDPDDWQEYCTAFAG